MKLKTNDEFCKGDLFKKDSPFYYNPHHVLNTRRSYEKLYEINPIFWKIIKDAFKKEGIEFDLDSLNQDYISDVPYKKCIRLFRDEMANKQINVFKAIVNHALFPSDDEAKKADKWITVHEIHKVTGIKLSTIGCNLRDFRKPPSGRFSIIRRSRGERGKKVFEYCIIPDTKRRQSFDKVPTDLIYF